MVTSMAHPQLGGVSTHLSLLIGGLRQRGHKVHLIEARVARPPLIIRAARKAACRLAGRPYYQWLIPRMMHRLQVAVQNLDVALIHCHDPIAAAACGRIAKHKGIPMVATVHGPVSRHAVELGSRPDSDLVRYYERIEIAAWPQCSKIIAVDSGQAGIVIEAGAPREAISVIPNAVDVDEIDALKPSYPSRRYQYFITARRLVPKNGVQYAIEALTAVQDTDCRLLIAGDGPMMAKLRELAKRLGVAEKVEFLGAQSRSAVVALTWNAVGAIVPSVNVGGVIEATSLSALEAMATGRPVIASRLGGLAEIIDDARTGFLAPQRDHAQFARTMNKILSEPSMARAVGRNARQEVIKRFSKDRWVESVIAVYQGAIDELSNQGARQPVAAPTGSA